MPHHVDFRGRGQGPSVKPAQVTIQRRGTLAINCDAFERLARPLSVELLFDIDNRILGLRKMAPTAIDAYPVRAVGSPPTRYLIAGSAFTRYHEIATDIECRWDATFRAGILSVDLTTPGVVLRSTRNALRAAP